jgi:hypothetical protein
MPSEVNTSKHILSVTTPVDHAYLVCRRNRYADIFPLFASLLGLIIIGFIGGSILSRLLKHPKRDTFDITILIRDSAKAESFESFGLKVVIVSLNSLDKVERLSHEYDIVFQSVSRVLFN